jgi:steroid delta-isomerase-like uncharacterized protein
MNHTTTVALVAIAACASTPHAKEPAMTTNADLARTYFEMWNRADVSAADRAIAENVSGHVNGATLHGRETFKQRVAALWTMYPQAAFTLEDLISERDRVVARWTFRGTNSGPAYGKPATGRTVTVTGVNVFRIAGEKIAEVWVSADDLGELEQLGFYKSP